MNFSVSCDLVITNRLRFMKFPNEHIYKEVNLGMTLKEETQLFHIATRALLRKRRNCLHPRGHTAKY